MTTKSAGKASFRIDDILDKPKEEVDDNNNKNAEKFMHRLKRSESSVFQPYDKQHSEEAKARLDFEKNSAESFLEKSYRDSIYQSDKYGVSNRSVMMGCQPGYGYGRMHLPYVDAYGVYGGAMDNHASWNMIPSLINSYGYHHLAYSPYLRPLPVSLAKRKGGQVRFTPQQTQNLERRFGAHKYLSPEDRRILAEQLKLSDRQVKTWFQNRRAKWRRANNITSNDGEDIESDNQSEGESSKDIEYKSSSPISV